MVISHRLWQQRFGGDPSIVGEPVRTAGGAMIIAGVMPPDFKLPVFAEAWIAMARDSGEMRGRTSRYFLALGRIKSGASISDAEAEMKIKFESCKLKDKTFAAGVSREEVERGVALIGLERSEHIRNVIEALRSVGSELAITAKDVAR